MKQAQLLWRMKLQRMKQLLQMTPKIHQLLEQIHSQILRMLKLITASLPPHPSPQKMMNLPSAWFPLRVETTTTSVWTPLARPTLCPALFNSLAFLEELSIRLPRWCVARSTACFLLSMDRCTAGVV